MSTIQVTVNITKEEVYTEVRKIAAYKAVRGEDGGQNYERVSLTEYQSEILDRFWNMSITTVDDILKPYFDSVLTDDEEYNVKLAMPSNWNANLKDDFVETIKNYIVHTIASMWMRFVDGKEEEKWGNDSASFIAQIKRKLYDRVRPKRPGVTCSCQTENSESDED